MSKLISLDGLQSLISKLKDVFVTEKDILMEGPDGGYYKLVLDENFRLMLEEKISARQVTYLVSNNEYYYLTEDSSGIYLAKYEGTPNIEESGVVVAVSKDTGMKFTIDVEDNVMTFNLCEGSDIDLTNSARYMICNDKLCYFIIENDEVQIYYEYIKLTMDDMQVK